MPYLLNRRVSLAPFKHLSHSSVHLHSCSFPLSVELPRTPFASRRSSLSISLDFSSPAPSSLLPPTPPLPPSLTHLSARTSTTVHPRHHPVTSPIALFHAPDRECALISHSRSPCLPLAPSSPLILPFAFSASQVSSSVRLPFLASFPSPILIFPSICTLRHYRPPSRGRNSLEERQGAECRRNPPPGTAHLRNLPSAMPSITLTACTIFLLSLAIDMIPSVQIIKTSLLTHPYVLIRNASSK